MSTMLLPRFLPALSIGCILGLWSTTARAQTVLSSTSTETASTTRTSTMVEGSVLGVESVDGLPEYVMPMDDEPREYTIDEISVKAKRLDPARIGGSAYRVDEQELERFEYDDIQRVLNKVPGVYVREEDGYGLRPNIGLRGVDPNRSSKVTLMEDGVLLAPAPYSAPAAYYFPLTTRLAGIDVFKGPAGVRYGPNTIGGAINLLSPKIPRYGEHVGLIDVSLGRFAYGKVHGRWMYGDEHTGILLEGVHVQTDGFKELDGGGDTGFAKNELLFKAEFDTPKTGRLEHRFDVRFLYSDEESNETYLGINPEDFATTPYRRYAGSQLDYMQWQRTSGALGYTLGVSEIFELQTRVYRSDFHRQWNKLNRFGGTSPALYDVVNGADAGRNAVLLAVLRGDQDTTSSDESLYIGPNDRDFFAQGVQTDGRLSLETGPVLQTVQFGLRYHRDQIERLHTERAYLMESGTLVLGDDARLTTADNTADAWALAAYLIDEVIIADRLFVTPGLRIEHIETSYADRLSRASERLETVDTVLIPGVGLYVQALDWLGFLAGVHRGFSPVSPGNPDEVEPELAVNYEAGARVSHNKTRAELIGFYSDYSNLLTECTFSRNCDPSDLGRQFNNGEVDTYGLELVFGHVQRLPKDLQLLIDVTYTLTRSVFSTSFEPADPTYGKAVIEAGDERPYIPMHQGALKLGLQQLDWSLNAALTYVGQMRDEPGQGEIPENLLIDDAWILDLAGEYDFNEVHGIYARADNILDFDYIAGRRPFGPRPGKRLSFAFGYRARF